jgi:V/A-type H+-transporting ATPase subunit E
MENKIQELTDKIYREGVEKGNEEAQRLVANAQEEAKRIVEEAQKEAKAIVDAAHKSAGELAENTKSELRLFAGQSVEALKSEIASLVTDKVVSAAVKDFVNDKNYFNAFVVALAGKWSTEEPIVISTADAEGLKQYFVKNAKALLDKGVEIRQVNGVKTLFSVSPANGAYKVNFGEEEFKSYFEAFLRPQLVEMLFAK